MDRIKIDLRTPQAEGLSPALGSGAGTIRPGRRVAGLGKRNQAPLPWMHRDHASEEKALADRRAKVRFDQAQAIAERLARTGGTP